MYNTKHAKTVNSVGAIQGDVPVLRIDRLPDGVRLRKDHIVAFGEATGHHHILETDAQVYEDGLGNLFAKIEYPVRLLHHQHAPIVLNPGVYQIGLAGVNQVEYAGEEERRVVD